MAKTSVPAKAPDDGKKPGTELQVYDFGDDAGKGTENMTKDEMRIPFFRILQGLSPQCKPVRDGGLEGASPGMIINLGTGEMIDGETGFDFVPVKRDHNFVEYIPRTAGGGFVGIHMPDDELIIELRNRHGKFGKLPTNGGNEISETYYLYVLAIIDGDVQQIVIGFTSTQIKHYQTMMTRVAGIKYPSRALDGSIRQVEPPLWAHTWHASTTLQRNKSGEYYGWRITLKEEPPAKSLLPRTEPLYIRGREFYDMLSSGALQADMKQAAQAEPEAGTDEEIPF